MDTEAAGAATPTPTAEATHPQPSADGANNPADEAVAQDWFDEWSQAVEERIGHLEDAIGHVIASKQAGVASHARPAAAEPGTAPGRTAQQGEGAEGAGLDTSLSQLEPEPERAPKPQHWWFRTPGGR